MSPAPAPANRLKLGRRGLALIKAFESFCPHPYDDWFPMAHAGEPRDGGARSQWQYREWTGGPVRGELTIGCGHTEAAGLPQIVRGMRITQEAASMLLDADLDAVERDVNRVIIWPLEQHEFDALCSFHFNCYGLILRGGNLSTCCKLINRGPTFFPEAMRELGKWNHQQGQVKPGLTRRRAAERALFEGRFDDAESLAAE